LGASLSSGSGGSLNKNEMTMYFDDVSREGAKTLKKEAILKHLVAIPSSTTDDSSSLAVEESSIEAPPPMPASTLIEKATSTTPTVPPKETGTASKIKKISESEINAETARAHSLTKEEILLKRLRLGYNAETARNLSPAEGELSKNASN
jgi:hypothetical protein